MASQLFKGFRWGERGGGPNPPVRNAALGKQETTHKQKGEEEEAASCAGDHLIPGKGTKGSEHSNAHAVHQKQQQDIGEEPAMHITHNQTLCLAPQKPHGSAGYTRDNPMIRV